LLESLLYCSYIIWDIEDCALVVFYCILCDFGVGWACMSVIVSLQIAMVVSMSLSRRYCSEAALINRSPLRSPSPASIRAEWLPNCIAFFFLPLASRSPTFRAASRSSILSPSPSSSRGSSLRCTGSPARNETTVSERKGWRVSLPCEEMTRSSRPRLRVGMRSSSSWS
jgi:hypothetical protein